MAAKRKLDPRVDTAALEIAAEKLRRLRIETVCGDKERPAETVRTVLERGWRGLDSHEGVRFILESGLRYYLDALPAPPRSLASGSDGGVS